MEDLRKIKSKELLKEAFWQVLETKKYSEIYIKDIVEAAGVNRKTFTAHYDTVDGLMRDCLAELVQKLLAHFRSAPSGDSITFTEDIIDFSYSTKEYTRFALSNRKHLKLIFSNQLDSVALQMWKKYLTTTRAYPHETDLRYDLYLNYSMYCCWGNLLWVLDHADLPLETLVTEALDVYHAFARQQNQLYEMPEYGKFTTSSGK